jgi:hypothetical protein
MNCGQCGKACPAPQPHQNAMCTDGQCKTSCDFGYVPCDQYCVGIALLENQRAFAVCAVLAALQ